VKLWYWILAGAVILIIGAGAAYATDGGWLTGALAGGVTGLYAWLFGRKEQPSTAVAQARLDTAVELGTQRVEEANREADAEVQHGMDEHPTLGDYLDSRTGYDD
jgi:hypothetical protein